MKETSRSLLFSFQETKCAQTLCDASDCFHTLLRLQRMIRKKNKKKRNFITKYYTPKIWSLHNILRLIIIIIINTKIKIKNKSYKRTKEIMPLRRLTTHLGKVKTNPSNYYIPNKKQYQL